MNSRSRSATSCDPHKEPLSQKKKSNNTDALSVTVQMIVNHGPLLRRAFFYLEVFGERLKKASLEK